MPVQFLMAVEVPCIVLEVRSPVFPTHSMFIYAKDSIVPGSNHEDAVSSGEDIMCSTNVMYRDCLYFSTWGSDVQNGCAFVLIIHLACHELFG